LKDALHQPGYRWQVSERAWQKIFDASQQQDEIGWLIENNTPNPDVIKIKATDTFSVRAQSHQQVQPINPVFYILIKSM
jgi:DNA polymerase-3 subunit epsilon